MNIKQLIEEINKLTEDELVDEFEDTEVEEVAEPEATEEVNTTQKLDAKTKISRALDILKDAIEDFKNTTVEEVDLVADADLVACFESLDEVANKIESILAGNKEAEEVEDTEVTEESEEIEDESEDEDESDDEDIDFDAEAELDLFGDKE